MQIKNFFFDAGPPSEAERFDTLLSARNLVIERIVSSSAIASEQMVQRQDEWVLLLQGEATLRVADASVELRSGDYLFLPSGVPHAVERVSHGAIWLAVHLHPELASPSIAATASRS